MKKLFTTTTLLAITQLIWAQNNEVVADKPASSNLSTIFVVAGILAFIIQSAV